MDFFKEIFFFNNMCNIYFIHCYRTHSSVVPFGNRDSRYSPGLCAHNKSPLYAFRAFRVEILSLFLCRLLFTLLDNILRYLCRFSAASFSGNHTHLAKHCISSMHEGKRIINYL